MTDSIISAVANSELSTSSEIPTLQAGYNVSLTDFSSFEASLAAAESQLTAAPVKAVESSESAIMIAKPLEFINNEGNYSA